jgi:hypothetical protein
MDEKEKEYREELKANGVDLPELEEPTEPEESTEEPKEEPKEPTEPLQTEPKEQRKRSIYDEYKEKKAELKSERELREQAEKERDELQRKLDAASTAPEHKQDDAEDDAIAYAKKVGADSDLVRRIIEEARKGLKNEPDESLKKDLQDFKAWKSQNSKVMEQHMFNTEFEQTVPALKELFPKVSADELNAMKEKLDAISHTTEWHDKSLDYIAFKHKDELSALVSPKKRGMESNERKDVADISSDFDPNPDFTKMSLKQREAWEAEYNSMMKQSQGISQNAQGRKVII